MVVSFALENFATTWGRYRLNDDPNKDPKKRAHEKSDHNNKFTGPVDSPKKNGRVTTKIATTTNYSSSREKKNSHAITATRSKAKRLTKVNVHT